MNRLYGSDCEVWTYSLMEQESETVGAVAA